MGGLLEKSQESGASVALPAGAWRERVGPQFVGIELVSDAVLAGFTVFRNAGPLKCGETALNSTHAGDVRIPRARKSARAHMNNKGGL